MGQSGEDRRKVSDGERLRATESGRMRQRESRREGQRSQERLAEEREGKELWVIVAGVGGSRPRFRSYCGVEGGCW